MESHMRKTNTHLLPLCLKLMLMELTHGVHAHTESRLQSFSIIWMAFRILNKTKLQQRRVIIVNYHMIMHNKRVLSRIFLLKRLTYAKIVPFNHHIGLSYQQRSCSFFLYLYYYVFGMFLRI